MSTERSQIMSVNGSKRLTAEQRELIPRLYASMGSKAKVAKAIGCSIQSVTTWMDKLTGEEWDRIKEEQRKVLLERSVDILYETLNIVPGKLPDATVRELMGVVKIMADRIALWGGVGAAGDKNEDGQDSLQQFLAAAESKRRQTAIEEALRTGSVEGLRAFATFSATDAEQVGE